MGEAQEEAAEQQVINKLHQHHATPAAPRTRSGSSLRLLGRSSTL